VEAPNSLSTWEFGGYAHYSEWAKVADAMIEAGERQSTKRPTITPYLL